MCVSAGEEVIEEEELFVLVVLSIVINLPTFTVCSSKCEYIFLFLWFFLYSVSSGVIVKVMLYVIK